MAPTLDKMEDDLMQLTLQIRNRKDDDKRYGKFHGDSLIGVSVGTFASGIGTEMYAGSNYSTSWAWWRSERCLRSKELVCAQESI
jgi:hypothetical protein